VTPIFGVQDAFDSAVLIARKENASVIAAGTPASIAGIFATDEIVAADHFE
jgi:hypothetical protein